MASEGAEPARQARVVRGSWRGRRRRRSRTKRSTATVAPTRSTNSATRRPKARNRDAPRRRARTSAGVAPTREQAGRRERGERAINITSIWPSGMLRRYTRGYIMGFTSMVTSVPVAREGGVLHGPRDGERARAAARRPRRGSRRRGRRSRRRGARASRASASARRAPAARTSRGDPQHPAAHLPRRAVGDERADDGVDHLGVERDDQAHLLERLDRRRLHAPVDAVADEQSSSTEPPGPSTRRRGCPARRAPPIAVDHEPATRRPRDRPEALADAQRPTARPGGVEGEEPRVGGERAVGEGEEDGRVAAGARGAPCA